MHRSRSLDELIFTPSILERTECNDRPLSKPRITIGNRSKSSRRQSDTEIDERRVATLSVDTLSIGDSNSHHSH